MTWYKKASKAYYHVAISERVPKIIDDGIKSPAYVWDNLEMALWFKKLHEDKEYSDDSKPMTILIVDVSGLTLVPDRETEDMSYWSSQFAQGMSGGGWVIKEGVEPSRISKL